MLNRLRAYLLAATALAFVTVPLIPAQAEAQAGSRSQIIVPNLQPTDDSSERWGRQTTDEIRDLLDLDRYVAVRERDIDDAARDYDMRYRDLDCILARQLASAMNVPLVLCGTYHEQDDGMTRIDASVWTVPGAEELPIDPVYTDGDRDTAAEGILTGFEQLADRIEAMDFCQETFVYEEWEEAADNYCQRAVEYMPDERTPRFQLARALMELERYEESLDHFEYLIEMDERDDRSLQFAGYVSSQLELADKARNYYSRYLEMNPDDTVVRISVAYQLAQAAGDPYGAMEFIAVGLEQEPDNVELLEQHGSFAFRAAQQLRQEAQFRAQGQDGDVGLPSDVAELYRTASESLLQAFRLEGAESNPNYARDAARAFMQLEEDDAAYDAVMLGLEHFPQNAQLWSERATIESRLGNVDEAVAALEQALEINPELADARSRMGRYFMDAGRVDEAVRAFRTAAEAGERSPDALAGIILAQAHSNHISPEQDIETGLDLLDLIREFDISDEFRSQLDFWYGYGLMRRGAQVQEPQTLQSAQASRPMFERARSYLEDGSGYAETQPSVNLNNLLDAVNQYLEIQDAIIRREGRR